jgi:putative tryptophan/tyrosine transport system substrate-binding protein
VSPLGSTVNAQDSTARKVPRVGYVTSEIRSPNVDAFEQGLRELGYVIGQSLTVDYRFGEGHVDRIPALVAELLRLGVDVLFAASPYVIRAARQATSTVPIVGIDLETDPMEVGWVKSFARPGGNLTGFFLDIPELGGKQLQLLSETVPKLQRVAVLWDARVAGFQFKATKSAAQDAKVGLQSLAFQQPGEFAAALDAARNQQAQAIVLLSSPSVFIHRQRLADLALQYRLPAICIFPQFAAVGGLMGYGPNLPDLFRRAADYVDRIVRGASPADLPIQRPLVFKLVVNLRTARVLGLKIPQSVLGRADEVIQ